MKIIIFAGGTGKRFWPVSRINSPKQFSPLISGKPLLRLNIDRLLKGFNPEDIFVSTGKRYEKEVLEIASDLPKENLIFEPDMRDTGPAVTLAICYVREKFPDEPICIQWSDSIVKDEATFIISLKEAEKVHKEQNKTFFITVPARFPSPHRGYINFGEEIKSISSKITLNEFKSFKEKPDVDNAKKYIADGHFGWNPGYWVLDPDFYLDTVKKDDEDIVSVCETMVREDFSESSCKKFSELEKISADYLFAEKVSSQEALVLLSDIGWSDVGEWISLKEALQENDDAIVTKGNVIDLDSKDSIIYNLEDSKLVSTIGLEGMVVVNTKDAVAVFSKEDNGRLKEYLNKLEEEGKSDFI